MDNPDYGQLAYYERLVLKIKQEIVTGIRQNGDKLPSVREMAKQVKLNPNTVAKAYKQLEAEGVVEVRPGLGTFVNAIKASDDQTKERVILPKFQQLIIEAKAVGISKEQLQDWLNTHY